MKKIIVEILDSIGLKMFLKKRIILVQLVVMKLFNNLFNKTVVDQNKNYKSIPIIIISFNQLFYLKQLIQLLSVRGYENIIVIDNNSTYKPLLEYFEEIQSSVKLHRLRENYGHLVFWKVRELFEKYSKGYYVVTDADINPIQECPEDFLLNFRRILDKDYYITKVGFSLKIDDIPNTNHNKDKIIKWETAFWSKKSNGENFEAKIDTTFALYRPNYNHQILDFYNACRTKMPYMARHGGWYIDNKNLTEEQKFFFANCNESSSWRINEEGNINKKIYLK
jgi:hypothetical protein